MPIFEPTTAENVVLVRKIQRNQNLGGAKTLLLSEVNITKRTQSESSKPRCESGLGKMQEALEPTRHKRMMFGFQLT